MIVSVETLIRQKMMCGRDEVLQLVQHSLEENNSPESFTKTI